MAIRNTEINHLTFPLEENVHVFQDIDKTTLEYMIFPTLLLYSYILVSLLQKEYDCRSNFEQEFYLQSLQVCRCVSPGEDDGGECLRRLVYHVLELSHHRVAGARPTESEEEVVVLRVLDGLGPRPEDFGSGRSDIR